MCSSRSFSGGSSVGAPIIRSLRLLVHREGDDLADVRLVGQQHDDAVDAGRDAAVRRRAVVEGAAACRRTAAPPPPGCSRRCSNALNMISGRWLRMAPEHSSMPLQTMSYCQARMFSGSCVSSASSPPCGIENGLWQKSICSVSSSHSYIGKSTIQQNAEARPPRSGPAPRRRLVRTGPTIFGAVVRLVGRRRTPRRRRSSAGSASSAASALRSGTWRSGPCAPPPSQHDVAQARPPCALRARVQHLVEEAARLPAASGAGTARTTRARARRCRRTP